MALDLEQPDDLRLLYWLLRMEGAIYLEMALAGFRPSPQLDEEDHAGVCLFLVAPEMSRFVEMIDLMDPAPSAPWCIHDGDAEAMIFIPRADLTFLLEQLKKRNALTINNYEEKQARLEDRFHDAQDGASIEIVLEDGWDVGEELAEVEAELADL